MAVELDFLKTIPYFAGLDQAETGSLKEHVFEKNAGKGEVVLLEGGAAEAIFFVFSGAVKIFKTSAEGKEQILSIVRPGGSFNDVAIFDGGTNPAGAQAMVPVTLYGIKKDEFNAITQDHPQVARNIIKVLAGQVRQMLSLVEDLSFRHVIGRIAKILLENAGDEVSPKRRLTQQEMAAMAGTAREVVARTLKSLEDDGIIRLERHQLVIVDKDALQEMVEDFS